MKFSRLQLMFVLILTLGISNHVLLLPHLLKTAKRDAWVCVIIAYFILIFWGWLIHLIIKKNGKEKLSSWLKYRTNSFTSGVITLLLFIYIAVSGIITFEDFIKKVHIYFLPLTPTWILVFTFLLLCIGAAFYNLKTIVYMSTVLLPFVWLLGHFVAVATLPEKDYAYLFPLFTHGIGPILEGIVIVLGGSVDILILLLLQHHVKKSFNFLSIFILITILMGLVLGPAFGSISAFGPNVAALIRFPAFEQWRLVMLGEYFSHLDFLAIFQLLSGATLRIALFLFLIYDLFDNLSTFKQRTTLILYSILLAMFSIYPTSDIWMTTVLRNYFYPVALTFGVTLTLVLVVFSYLPQRKNVGESV
ncbi:endospore germination permease [Alkalihalobacterium chitinilyticum]|uniref:Endospore germination permease n=1 Tax=Alkalihalobacterium chitinilyticum TaxID=2980103 RepID=A0ABT5VEY3_9BACI|nr:endospore germination permease [Alkalihalobacterium chitinilyticum]MDE5412769.1 endospore germination permease [Alkalihalobacterium chitinilyticum]